MTACLILLGALIVAGILLKTFHKEEPESIAETEEIGSDDKASDDEAECCGTHLICSKINTGRLSPVEYYDDEELDAYKGKRADEYSPDEVEEFRDVLLSLIPADIAGWGQSLEKRGIEMPLSLRDEYILLLGDQ